MGIGSPELWAISLAVVAALFVLDFIVTRRPHEVSMKEAIGWSAFYIALPLAFGVWIWTTFGSERGLELKNEEGLGLEVIVKIRQKGENCHCTR